MAADEESQIAEDFGRMLRIATGSALQLAEMRQRRQQMQTQADTTEARELRRIEENAARVVHTDLYRNEFWKYAGAESIADRMAVAATLGETNPAAQSAWMHGADVIREMYGIDLQKINREHPSSQEERHAALRDALDDRLQMNQLDTQADRVRESAPAQERPVEQPAQDAEELEADADRERMEEGEALERADRAEDATRDDDAVVDTDGLAARRAFARERAEEAEAAPKTPEQRAAETERVNLELLEQTAPELVQVRVRQLQSFALNPSKTLEATKPRGRRPRGGQGTEQERQELLSR